MKPLIIALGGNALIRMHEIGNYAQQMKNITRACEEIAALAKKDTPLVITHGNGPQVGNLELQMQAASPRIPTMPLHVEVGMTQGEIGHLIAFGMKKWLPSQAVSVLLTHVEVDAHDDAFKRPTKPIGPWYKTSQQLSRGKIPFIHDAKKGFRKVVASPTPQKIIEIDAIKTLLEKNHIVVACGGGGIPVTRHANKWSCADAVIDKDLSTQVLGNALSAKEMIILTDESYAYADYRTARQKELKTLSLEKARHLLKQGHFGAGSMEPKVKASIRFIQKGGKTAYVGKTGELDEVLNHEKGTRFHR